MSLIGYFLFVLIVSLVLEAQGAQSGLGQRVGAKGRSFGDSREGEARVLL